MQQIEATNGKAAFRPLLVDVAIPLGIYFAAHEGLGLSLIVSLALGSVVPGAHTVIDVVRHRRFNGLAGLMLVVNVLGIVLSFVSGDPRLMIAKDSMISSVIGLMILVSAFGAKPLMSAALQPIVTKGDAARTAAWDRLHATSARFRGLERRFSLIWGAVLLAECVARIVGAFALPVETMAWLSAVMVVGAIAVGFMLSGGTSEPIARMVAGESAPKPEFELAHAA